MKRSKILFCVVAFVLGVCATQAFGQQSQSVLVQPQARAVGVDVAVPFSGVRIERRYVMVQPRPVMVTRVVTPRPPKPLFWTPIRDKIWRHKNRPSVRYYATPY